MRVEVETMKSHVRMHHHAAHDLIPSIEALAMSLVGLALALPLCVALLAGISVSTTTAAMWVIGTALGVTAFMIERWFVPRETQDEEPVRLTMGAAGFVTLLGALLSLFAFVYASIVTP
jgi:hypothetical protein